MSDVRKKAKTKRDDYSHLEGKKRQKKSLVFGKKAKEKRKKLAAQENASFSPSDHFIGEHGIFGVPLSVAVSRMPSHDGVPLPVVVRQCIDYITDKGLNVEGIFRISAPKPRLDELEFIANCRKPVVLTDVHDASGLLKRFLRQLPEHTLTDEMRNTFEQIAAECPCKALPTCRCLVADLLKAQLSRLPSANYTLLAYVFLLAQQIVANRERNKMGVAALGLLLQATLNLSQTLLRIFLLNASDLISQDSSLQVVYLFKDVQIKRYIEPREPRSICENDLPESEDELSAEEEKQRSRLSQLHKHIAELREMNLPIHEREEEMWDVQTAITLLNRKLKLLRTKRIENVNVGDAEGPALEMFEEKQLLASCIALREDISRHKSEIIAIESRLHSLLAQKESTSKQETAKENENEEEDASQVWRAECLKEESRKEELLRQIIEQKEACCLLRAKLEMNLVKQPKLLVTRF